VSISGKGDGAEKIKQSGITLLRSGLAFWKKYGMLCIESALI
jgi:hypothetical protein